MTDKFDQAAAEFFNGPWQFMRMVTPDVRGRYVAAQASLLRDTHNTALDAAAEAVRTNTLLSGSIGPLMDMGWNAANKAGADAVLKLKVES